MTPQLAIGLSMLIPLLGCAFIAAARVHPNLRETCTLLTALALFACVLVVADDVLAGGRPALALFEVLPGIAFGFRADPLSVVFSLVASGLWIVNSVYSIGYMRANNEAGQTRFFICFAAALAFTMGIAFAANLLTLFLFYEALTLVTWPLVTHNRNEAARRGGRVYLAYLLGSSMALFLVAIVATWLATGTVEFTPGGIINGSLSTAAMGGLLALFIFGLGKAAVMPMHRWLPAAMVAPTPVSALLHAVAVVKAGVYGVVKVIVYVFGVDTIAGLRSVDWLPALAGFTIIAASIVALRSDNLKRRLAYSTISQLSYVVLAAALLTPLSIIGAVMHIAAHALGKITLFFAAGAIYTAAHKTLVSELDGIGRRMPWTMTAFAIGAISMIGLPPAAGFLSKWFMLQGAVASAQWTAVAVIVGSTLLNAAYFLPIVWRAFFVPPAHDTARGEADGAAIGQGREQVRGQADGELHGKAHGEAPWPMVAALTVTAAGTILLFFFPAQLLALARAVAGV